MIEVFERVLLFDGDESGLDFSSPEWGPYAAFPGFEVAQNGDYVMVYRRAAGHGITVASSTLRVNISPNQGRTWWQKRDEIILEIDPITDPYSPAVRRLLNGELFLTYERDRSATPSRLTYGRRSSDGRTWGAEIQFPYDPHWAYTSAGGKVLPLGGDVLLATHYHRDFISGTSGPIEHRYISEAFLSLDNGNSWTWLSTVARDPNPAGLQFEEPQIIRLQDGRILCLVRSDDDETIYGTWSPDEGATWTPLHVCFPGHGWPALCQCSNGVVVAMTRSPTATTETAGHPAVWTSQNGGAPGSWVYQGKIGENVPALGGPSGPAGGQYDPKGGSYMYGEVQEIEPNIIAFASSQDQTAWGRTRLWFMKAEVKRPRPAVPYHRTRVLDTSEDGNRGWNFGTSPLLNGATSFLMEIWLRFRNRGQPGIILRHGNASNNQQHFDLRYAGGGSAAVEITIANALNNFARGICPTNYFIDDEWVGIFPWYHGGGGPTDSDKLKLFVGRKPDEAPAQVPLTFSGGAIPAQMTAPVTSAVWTLGTVETGSVGSGFHGLISELRIWENPDPAVALAAIPQLYNQRLPRLPEGLAIGDPAVWIASDAQGNVSDLRGRFGTPSTINGPSTSSFFVIGPGYLELNGRYPFPSL